MLVAVGRGPRTENIGLETVDGIEVERGFIKVDRHTMQTGAPGVYAVGDIVAGTPQLAHVGFAEAIAAVTHLATGRSAPVNYQAIPRVTYTHPEFAEVGMTEAQARETGRDIEVHNHGMGGVGRAIIIGQNRGSVKVVSRKGRRHSRGFRRRPSGGRADPRTDVRGRLGGVSIRGSGLHSRPPDSFGGGRGNADVGGG